MSTTVEQLEIEVESSSSSAVKGIDALSASLQRLKNATKGGIGLTSVTRQVNELATSLNGLDSTKISKIERFAQALGKLKSVGSIKISSTIGNQLNNISKAVNGLDTTNFGSLDKLSKGIGSLGDTNVAKGLRSTINALTKLPKLSETMNTIDWATFSAQMSMLSSSLDPLATKLNTVSTAFSRLPGNINKTNTAVERSVLANAKAKFSWTELYSKLQIALGILRTGVKTIAGLVNQSNEYVEDLNLFDASMGEYADSAQKYAEKVSELLGIDPGDFMRNQGVFNTIITGFGVGAEKAQLMSKNLTQLGYDLSSFYNISVNDSMQKVQSGISGELEPLRRLGFDLSVARLQQEALNLGISKSVSNMTQAEKSQLRYYAMLTQVTVAQGDMARTLNAPANQLRVLQAQFQMCARAIGNIFIPVLNMILPYVIAVVKVIRLLANTIAGFFGFKLPEIDYSGITVNANKAAKATNNMANGADKTSKGLGKASKAAKKLKNALLGIDELNVLSKDDDTASAGGGTGGGVGGAGGVGGLGGNDLGIELPTYDFLKGLVSSKVDGIVKEIKKHLWSIISVIGAVVSAIAAFKIAKFLQKLGFIGKGLKPLIGIAMLVGGAFLYASEWANGFINGVDWNILIGLIAGATAVIGGLWLAVSPFAAVIGAIVTGVGMLILGIKDAIDNGLNMINGLLIAVGSVLGGAGIGALIGSIGGPLGSAIGLIVGLVIDGVILIIQNWDSIVAWLKKFFTVTVPKYAKMAWDFGVSVVESILKGAWSIITGVAKWFYSNLIKPIIDIVKASPIPNIVIGIFNNARELWNKLAGWWKTVSKDGISVESLISLAKSGWDTVAGWVMRFLGGLVTKGINLGKSGWSTVARFIQGFMGSAVTKGIGLFRAGWNTVSQFISWAMGGPVNKGIGLLKSGWNTVSQWVTDRIGGIVDVGINLVSKWKGNIKEFFGLSRGGVVSAHGGIKMFASGGVITPHTWQSIPKYAGGTSSAAHGSMFVAGENGAELVGHVNGTTEVMNRFQLGSIMHSAIVNGMAQFTGYWQAMNRNIVDSANAMINAVLVSADSMNENMQLAMAEGYNPYTNLARTVYDDNQRGYNGTDDDSWERKMREFYQENVEPTLREIANDTKRQADKNEKTIVQVGNRTVKDAVTTQNKADGFDFTK